MRALVLIPVLLFAFSAEADTGLVFPSDNSDGACKYMEVDDHLDETVAFKWDFPSQNGLHWFGPDDIGVTYTWELKSNYQVGYYTTFFYSKGDGDFESPYETYYGAHPFPQPSGVNMPNAYWEIAGMGNGADEVRTGPYNDRNDPPTLSEIVKTGIWFKQALVIEPSPAKGISAGKHVATFYTNLPSVDSFDFVQVVSASGYGSQEAPLTDEVLYFGNAPWCFGNEKMSGTFRNLKIWARPLSQQEIIDQAGDDAQLTKGVGTLGTGLWYHNPNPTPTGSGAAPVGIQDLSGETAHNPVWVNDDFLPSLYSVPEPSAGSGFAVGAGSCWCLAALARRRRSRLIR